MDGSEQPRDDRDIVRGRDGKPLRDRYGRPIYRRSAQPRPERPERPDGRERPHRPERRDRPERPESLQRPGRPARPRTPEGYLTRADVEKLRQMRADDDRRRARDAGRRGAERPRPTETQMFQRPEDPRFPPRGYDPDRDYAHRSRRSGGYPEGYADGRADRDGDGRGRGGGRRKALPFADRLRRDRRPRNIGFKIKAFLLVLLLVIGAGAMWVDFNLGRVDAFAGGNDRPGRSVATNWLLVGSDSRAGLTDDDAAALSTGAGDFGQRTDTIMIAHFPLFGKGRLVSLPRDSYVDIPGYGQNKINAAYSFGGAQLLAQTIEHNTGIRIDHYAEIGFGGFASIVDAMGGIEMCPAEPIQDPLAGLDIQAGCQKFDGAAGLGYVRTRATAQGDLDRVARQREFMGAMMGRVASPAVWLNPWRWYRLGSAGAKALTVDSGDHVWHLAWLMLRMALGTESETVPTAGTMDTGHAGNVLLWDDAVTPGFFRGLK